MNLPNKLSVFRIVLAFIFMIFLLLSGWLMHTIALILFIIASLTDFLDGYLARKNQEVTNIGKLLDPLADKVLMAAAFISFVELGWVPSWMVVVIITREFCVTGLRLIASVKGRVLEASCLGKQKTVSQVLVILIFLTMMIVKDCLGSSVIPYEMLLISVMMYVTVALTVFSGFVYFYQNLDVLSEEGDVYEKMG
jgi:CDP-diacylglycerol--glycerol-3-phosphate 3-phosphatidyltransferase